ncbi:MAG: PAS domain-containing protein [Candidatus Magnetomorum sp.]|nr:PAS domain-containing protein [Candidatus Magnetomorum sp.]
MDNTLDKSIFERTVPDTSESSSIGEPKSQPTPTVESSSVEMQQMRAALEKASSKARVLDFIPTPIMTVDKELRVTYMNNAGLNALNLASESVIGRKCCELFKTDHCNTSNCQVAKAMRENAVFTGDTVAKLPSGHLPIRYSGAPLKDEKGNIIGGIEYVLDISKEASITQVVTDLSKAAKEGRLDARADNSQFEGNFRSIVKGINDTLDAVIGPLNVTAEYVDRISKGSIPEKITDDYKGDFNKIKNNVNQCIDVINGLVTEVNTMTDASIKGRLDIRGDAQKFSGDYLNIINGINKTVDTLVGHIDKIPTPVMIIDKNFSIQYLNKTGTDILSVPQNQIIGQKCYTHFKTSDCQNSGCACGRAMISGNTEKSETDAHPGKHHLEISYTGSPI